MNVMKKAGLRIHFSVPTKGTPVDSFVVLTLKIDGKTINLLSSTRGQGFGSAAEILTSVKSELVKFNS